MRFRTLFLSCCIAGVPFAASAADNFQQRYFVGATNANEIYIIDIATQKTVKTILLPRPHGFAATRDGKYVWAAVGFQRPEAAVAKIDAASGEVLEMHPMPGVDDLELANNDRDLYIPAFGTGCYHVFDTVDRKTVAKIETDGLPHNVVIPAKDPRFVYLSPMGRSVEEIDNFAKRNGGMKDCNGNPKASVPNDKIYVVDAKTRKVVNTIKTGPAPRPVTVTDDGTRMYVDVDGLMGIVALDLVAGKEIQRVEFPLTDDEKALASRTHGIWVSPDQKQVWSTSVNHNAVFVYDRSSGPLKFVKRVDVGKGPYWLAFSPDNKYGYSSNQLDGTVSVIDTATHKEVARLQFDKASSPHNSISVNVPMPAQSTE